MLPCRKYTFLAVTATAISFLAYGCGESRITQCNRLNSIANQAKKLTPPKDAEGFERIAQTIEAIGVEMRSLKLEDPKLKDFQARFAKVYTESAQAARSISKAYNDRKRDAAIAKITKEIESVGDRESSLISEINKYCAAQ